VKAITFHQPWATLIAIGAKRYETRTWPTNHRDQLAIHAGKALDKIPDPARDRLITGVLRMHGYGTPSDLPRGAVVAIARVVGVHQAKRLRAKLNSEERAFGDFSDGRYAWEIADVRPIDPPVPVRGRERFWEWNP
jgi:hypothetical protein